MGFSLVILHLPRAHRRWIDRNLKNNNILVIYSENFYLKNR